MTMTSGCHQPVQDNKAWPRVLAVAFLAVTPWLASSSLAQTVPAVPGSAAPLVKPVAPVASKSVTRPTWQELTPMQQQALKPLAGSWNTISEQQKRKWLQISNNYPSLSPAEQATLHARMNGWVSLSPQQRAQARLNYGKTRELSKQLTPEEKKAQWQTYQALSPEEKQKLAAKASPKPTGAATAVRPVSPQKLAAVPPHRVPKPGSKAAEQGGGASSGGLSSATSGTPSGVLPPASTLTSDIATRPLPAQPLNPDSNPSSLR
ncbi:DUF3106 domain-containing protein [Polaromonas sp. YR568]|uniref:DUF3106 domain-containing protein n=1 Tax=Polaromonas sp. YR568 TaxID=1855301 RepID=UPI0031378FD7